jgi:dTDP-4-amino-4,6-dideoxygalactose transaminase
MTGTRDDQPAVAGGTPAKTTPFGRQNRYGDEELAELREALAQGTLFYAGGQKVKQMEKAFAEQHGARFGVACTSGTAAIHAALIALGVSPGDEVIVPPITDMGTVAPVLWQGAIPVFADLDPRRYTLAPAAVEVALTPRTRAVIAVHLAGTACDLGALAALCQRRGVALLEDCAQALGCRYRGRPVGATGAVGCYSLNEFKHISCGDGGIAITNDEALAPLLRLATDKCYDRRAEVAVRTPRFLANNYRMTELQGAVALAQLRKLDGIVAARQRWCGSLMARLAPIEGLLLPQWPAESEPSWWFFMLRVVPAVLGADAPTFAQALAAEGLPCYAGYIGQCVYEYPVFTNHAAFAHAAHPYAGRLYGKGLCPQAEAILTTCVTMSVNEAYTDADLEETARAYTRVARWFHERGKATGSR